jgi:hypothetical protein
MNVAFLQDHSAACLGPTEFLIAQGTGHIQFHHGDGFGIAVSMLFPFLKRNLEPAKAQ